jgi:hypothetical protein
LRWPSPCGTILKWDAAQSFQRTGQFFWAFAVATAIVLAAFFCMFVIGRIEQVDWTPRG